MNRVISQRSRTVHEFFVHVDDNNGYIGAVLDEIRKQPGMDWVPVYKYADDGGMAFQILAQDEDFMLVKATIPDTGQIEAKVEIEVEGGLVTDEQVINRIEIERRRGVRVSFKVIDHDVDNEEKDEDDDETTG